MQLQDIVPWGRSFEEYRDMFLLTDADLQKSILGCGDGPAAFDLALCFHYLFLYSEHVNLEEHLLSMKELCRVANEVRVYPLVTLEGKRSPHLDPVVSELGNDGLDVSFHKAKYRFQKGAEEMLVVT